MSYAGAEGDPAMGCAKQGASRSLGFWPHWARSVQTAGELRIFPSVCSSGQAQAMEKGAAERAGATASAGEPCDPLLPEHWIQTGHSTFRKPPSRDAARQPLSPSLHLSCRLAGGSTIWGPVFAATGTETNLGNVGLWSSNPHLLLS